MESISTEHLKSNLANSQDKPLWKGEKEKHQKVLVWREQGIGDQIIFLSLLPEVKEMCSSLSVYVDPRLQALCKRAMPEDKFC